MPRQFYRPFYGFVPNLGAKQVPFGFQANGVHFNDTVPDYYTLAGGLNVTNGKAGSVICRFNTDAIDKQQYFFRTASNRMGFELTTTERIHFSCDQSASPGTLGANMNSLVASFAADTWYTVLIAWDVAVGVSAARMYVNGVDRYSTTGEIAVDATLRYTGDNLGVGATDAGGTPYDGCLQALAFSTTYVDWSDKANRNLVHNEFNNLLLEPGVYGTNWIPGGDCEMLWVSPYTSYTNTGSGLDSFTEVSAPDECSK